MESDTLTSGVKIQPTDKYPDAEVHVPADILFPNWQKWQGVVHLNADPPAIRPTDTDTGCDDIVNEKRASFSPKKVTCETCRKYASERHRDLWTMYEFIVDNMMGDDPSRRELELLIDYHSGHSNAFRDPL